MQKGYVRTALPGQRINSVEILMARKPQMQAIVRPEYILLATMDLRFPIPTPN
jgi:hypothetical protein